MGNFMMIEVIFLKVISGNMGKNKRKTDEGRVFLEKAQS
jgi:hypothetical protein